MRGWHLALLAALAGCDGSDRGGLGRSDSESHWLRACQADAECGELQCVCGVCTVPCADGCEGVAEGAVCAEAPAAACGGGATAICSRACGAADACGAAHLACESAACVPRADRDADGPRDAAPDVGSPGDAGAPDDGPKPTDLGVPDAAGDAADAGAPGPCDVPGSTCRADADCGGRLCRAPRPGDACVCLDPPPVVRNPCPADGCCADAECPGAGVCRALGYDAQNTTCGGAPPPLSNECTAHACAADADCGPAEACVLPGQLGFAVATCVPARCRVDADCREHPGGRCTGFFTPCYVRGFHCTYDEDPCRTDADCPQRAEPRVCLPFPAASGTYCEAVMPAP